MWLLVARPPVPDAPQWRGRRWLAAADALAWPLVLVLLLKQVSALGGIVWPVVVALAALAALRRLHRAVLFNHRYRFTIARGGGLVGVVLVLGAVLTMTLQR